MTTRVMIVDDHPMWREGVARDLGSRGYDVCATAADVAGGIRIAKATRPDVVVMDLQLGDGSGVDATREITAALAGLLLGEYRRLGAGPEVPQLTERETEVLRLVARGLTARQIATRLVLSHRTVENHVQNTLRKLQLHNRAELVRYAIEHGIDTSEQ